MVIMVRATAAPHHHHVVHPVLCCTVKRAVRLLPSALLLIFVLSLILVTLVQIAVIHSHRRAIYLQRRLASTSRPSPARPQAAVVSSSGQLRPAAASPDGGPSGSPTAHFQAWSAVHRTRGGEYSHRKPNASHNRAQAAVRARPNALQVEALLDRNAPTVDNNIKILTGLANAARIRDIFAGASAGTPRPTLTLPTSAREDTLGGAAGGDDNEVSWELVKDDVYRRAGGGGVSAVTAAREDEEDTDSVRRTRKFAADKARKSSAEVVTRPLCPEVPPGLVGRVQVDLDLRPRRRQTQRPAKASQNAKAGAGNGAPASSPIGGLWSPVECAARHRVALVVPYRDRRLHLLLLLRHLHPILRRQLLSYRIYVVEQYGNDTFNKGVLMNAGVREAFRDADYNCFVFHDVDLIPEDDRNMYSCPPSPRHMSVAIDKFNYTLPYQMLVGGVLAIKREHFLKVNGFSNLYWGWGGEDDDMAYRIKHKNLKIIRPPASVARYTMIKHHQRPESPNNIRMALVRMAWYRMNKDGLSTTKYRLVSKQVLPLYTHLLVDIGHNHKWHFSSSQKLIINL
ncbi:uncharacterized protein LOC142585160 [Dermacentor variabilis]|uniref:uncharacterized protein LOC142585160 n=1 Tax=Dermacentor variabilis TaxID=34621 RepID=UPI003F5CAFE5